MLNPSDITAFGSIITDFATFSKLPPGARRITSWNNAGFTTATGKLVKSFTTSPPGTRVGYYAESVLDTRNPLAVHKKLYVLFVIPYLIDGASRELQAEAVRKGRTACFAFMARHAA